jgi:RimJ/RimL family protein N-acetyltransferase
MITTCSCCEGEFADSEIRTYNHDTISQLCPACYELVDSQSSSRSLEIQPMREKDLELVLAWRNNPRIYNNFAEQDEPIRWDNHVAWYEQRPADREDYIIRCNNRRVGVVSLDKNDFVSIYIGEQPLWGQGIASRALKWLIQRYSPSRPLYAEVHTENDRSEHLFKQCGFIQSDCKNEWAIYQYNS